MSDPILVSVRLDDLSSIQAAGTGGRCPACCGGGVGRYRRQRPLHTRACWLGCAIDAGRAARDRDGRPPAEPPDEEFPR